MNPTSGLARCDFVDRTFPFVVTASGTGAGVSLAAGSPPNLGQAVVTSGTQADGKANIGTALNGLTFSGGLWVYEALVKVPVLSDATNSFKAHCGFFDGLNGGEYSAFFKYIHSYEGGQWTCQTFFGEEPANTWPSGVTVVAGQWYRLRIEADLSVPVVRYYIDGVFIKQFTANLPVGATTGAGVLMTKTLGTTARTLVADWLVLSCPRPAKRAIASGDWSSGATWEGGAAPGTGDSVCIPAPLEVTVSTPVVVNPTNASGPVFEVENGARVIVKGPGALLTVTQNTLLVIDGDIDVWTQLKLPPIAQVPYCQGRIRRMVDEAVVKIGDDGFCYRS